MAPGTAGPARVDALRELDSLVQANGNELDPRLRHYLERRSYAKAREWLRNSGGSCGCGT